VSTVVPRSLSVAYERGPRDAECLGRNELPTTIFEFCESFDASPVYTLSLSFFLIERDHMTLQEIVSQLRAERDWFDQALAALEGSAPRRGRPPKDSRGSEQHVMSAAARKRISAAMKARWAARKKRVSTTKTAKKPGKKAAGRRPKMSPAARKKLSKLIKARWAEKKKA